MEEVLDQVHRIELPRPDLPAYVLASPDEPIACHVFDGDASVLFGTGYALSTDQLLTELEAVDGLDGVVVEHGDSDHFGALPGIRAAYPDVTVAVPADDQVHLRRVYETPPEVLLTHGDTQWGFRAITIRGHTYGNMAFLDESRGILVAGDTVVGSESDIAPPGPWSGPLAPPDERFNANDAKATANLVKLAEYDFSAILLTHGEDIVTGADTAVDRLLMDLDLQWEL